jgi:hypothetical protein
MTFGLLTFYLLARLRLFTRQSQVCDTAAAATVAAAGGGGKSKLLVLLGLVHDLLGSSSSSIDSLTRIDHQAAAAACRKLSSGTQQGCLLHVCACMRRVTLPR